MIAHGGVGCFIGADGVILDGFTGRVFHQGHVLVGCCVVNHVRAVGGEDLVKTAAVSHGANECDKVEGGVFVFQLQLDVIGVILVDIEDDELLGIVSGNLAADLAADGAAASRDEDDLALEEGVDFIHADLDGLTAEKVFNGHVFEGGDTNLVSDELIHARELLDFAAGLRADVEDFTPVLRLGRGNGEKDFVDFIFFHGGEDTLSAADDAHTVNEAVPLVGVIVNNGAYGVLGVGFTVEDVTENHLPGTARTDEEDPGFGLFVTAGAKQKDETVGKANANGGEEEEDTAHDMVRDGHAPDEEGDDKHGDEGNDAGLHRL